MSRHDAVDAFSETALNNLYMTPDLLLAATVFFPLEEVVAFYHRQQPQREDFLDFADTVATTCQLWRKLRVDVIEADAWMAIYDLRHTYPHILRGLLAAVCTAFAILLRSQRVPDEAVFPRIIPPELQSLTIARPEDVNVATLHRILCAEPWVSWMERLRAQYARTAEALPYVGTVVDESNGNYRDIKINSVKDGDVMKAAKKSMRKSTRLFENLFGLNDLRTFIRGDTLIVQGKGYDYHLCKMANDDLFRNTIDLSTGSAPFHTSVYNKSGEMLSSVCLYYDDSPVLDQLISVLLAVKNEKTEHDLLAAAHVMEATRKFYDDPLLPELKGLRDPVLTPFFINQVIRHADTVAAEHTKLRKTLMETTLKYAFRAFLEINHFPKGYLQTIQTTSTFRLGNFWDNANLRCQEAVRAVHAIVG